MMPIHAWLDLLFPPRPDELVVRNISIEDMNTLLSPKLATITRPETIVLFSFAHAPIRSLIHEAKYHGSERAFTLLAHALSKYLENRGSPETTIIVPIPLGRTRRKERGFNQVEEVVRRAIKITNLTIDTNILERTRETISQISLPRHAREENMRGAFSSRSGTSTGKPRINPAYTYIVIDDVVTTGATLQAAIDALKEAGATHIIPLALAH